ncbi:MAG TPA: putative zinc-binding peptidase [Verrucomicrobiae bacterium]|nr:putative zinc-binding peptidase [Verrucomicrobiae bacterium]
MKIFYCDHCGNLVFFENVRCVKCGYALGFLPDAQDLSALEADADNSWRALAAVAKGRRYLQCQNGREHSVCNWLVPADDAAPFCLSCRLNQTIPDLTVAGNLERWHKLELAKRRLIYTLLHLHLPLAVRQNRPALQFNFLAEVPGRAPILTGHSNGLITLNIAEADDAEREKRRVSFHEPYRTLLGHFRHEIAHYYWDQLIADTPRLKRFRELFGDDSYDYSTALQAYYAQGAPADWQLRHVSAYASSHPWEDWAETFAHYLHIIDMIETAAGFGMTLRPKHPSAPSMTSDPRKVDETADGFNRILENWLPLTHALNSLNRGMGLPDIYPFVLSDPAVDKMKFIHETVRTSEVGKK